MTIEKGFFEAFGIEPSKHFFCGKHLPRYKCVCWDRARQRNSYCKDWDYKNKKCEFYTEDIERRYYPPITPEIVLELEEILNREYNILIIECMANSTKITACPAPEQDWGCDEAYYRVYVEEKDLRTAILKVCSNYNVAISIQDQVKALFNK